MYVYTYIHTYMYIYVCIYTHICVTINDPATRGKVRSTYVYVCVHVFGLTRDIYTNRHLHIKSHLSRDARVVDGDIHICIYVYICILTYMYIYMYIYVY